MFWLENVRARNHENGHIFSPETFATYPQLVVFIYKGADKSLPLPGGKQVTATEDFEFHISYL